MTQTDMRNFKHDECIIARGIKVYDCIKCGKTATNYTNGVNICIDCRVKLNLCAICGESLENDFDKVADILNNMFISKINPIDENFDKEYKIWEVLEMIDEPRIRFTCSINPSIIWKYDTGYRTFISTCEDSTVYDRAIEDNFNFIEILQSTFKVHKEDTKWIKIEEYFDLHEALVNNYKIRVNGNEIDGKSNKSQIITLFGMLEDGIATIEYLKENE